MVDQAADGYFHPATASEVRELVLFAKSAGFKLRVRGSGHSVAAAILARDGARHLDVLLDRMRQVRIVPEPDGKYATVEVGAGCNFGFDPHDPSRSSTWNNSLTDQLHRAGWALSSLAGISHQTISGFVLTGSAGGSVQHSFDDDIVRLEFVDGNGKIHDVGRDDEGASRQLFEAAGVSMGLLGVVTKITLRVRPAYNVSGREVTSTLRDSPVQLYPHAGEGRPLAEFLANSPYCRILWFPQPSLDRIQVRSAERVENSSEFRFLQGSYLSPLASLGGALLETVLGNLEDLTRVPAKLEAQRWFQNLCDLLAGTSSTHRPDTAVTVVRGRVLQVRFQAARMATWVAEQATGLAFHNPVARGGGRWLSTRVPTRIHHIMAQFLPLGVKEFREVWHIGLPMDDSMDCRLWPPIFTELWLPLDRAWEALRRIVELYRSRTNPAERYRLSRAFPVEVYPGPASVFWLSPGYGRACVRVSPIWFGQWEGDPQQELFQHYYAALRDLGFRPHWGKVLPPASEEWQAYYRRQFPRFADFLELRTELDPNQLFVSDYWREHLGIEPAV